MHPKDCSCWICGGSLSEPDCYPWPGVGKNVQDPPEPPRDDFDDDDEVTK